MITLNKSILAAFFTFFFHLFTLIQMISKSSAFFMTTPTQSECLSQTVSISFHSVPHNVQRKLAWSLIFTLLLPFFLFLSNH